MGASWRTRRLCKVADIRVSNVDKKIFPAEIPVSLCNYMDVYANEYITREIDFMAGSASAAEIQRFALKPGDVVITKDSESPDDIGVPAVVTDDIEDLICGYHLCLIRPDPEEVVPVFLAKVLAGSESKGYFAIHSSGSTRFGLAVGAIESLGIPVPPRAEQEKIAEILSCVDRSIDASSRIVAKRRRTKIGLMQDLLSCGIDKHGARRAEETHKFQDSSVGRIPDEWTCSSLSRFVPSADYGISSSLGDSGCPVLRMNNLVDGEADLADLKYTATAPPKKLLLREGDVLFNRTNSWEHVGRTGIWRGQIEEATFASYLVRLNPNPDLLLGEFLNVWLNWERTQIAMRRVATPAVQQVNINPTSLRSIPAAFPRSLDEQQMIVDRLESARLAVEQSLGELAKLQHLKTALMQDLLTGKVRVTPLLKTAEASA